MSDVKGESNAMEKDRVTRQLPFASFCAVNFSAAPNPLRLDAWAEAGETKAGALLALRNV